MANSAGKRRRRSVARTAPAVDANDDGGLDIADAVKILGHLFAQAGPLPDPFGACGTDPTSDDLGCLSYAPCE